MRRASFLAVPILLLCSAPVASDAGAEQTNEELKAELYALCETILCRPPDLTIVSSDGTTSEVHFPAPLPYVHNDILTIMPGETLYVEATIRDGRLADLIAKPNIEIPERTLVFEFRQESDFLLLEITNPFPHVVKYNARMMLPENGELHETTSCPIPSRGSAYEAWPHPIFQLVIVNFRLLEADDDAATVCVY